LGLPQDEIKVIFVNNKKVGLGTVLRDGDQLGLSPPVAGM
jgi:molybdopterin converting factor small subunit